MPLCLLEIERSYNTKEENMSEEREQKNAIFGGQTGQTSPIQVVDRVRDELGLDIAVETVPLPSLGKVYAQGSSLHGRETIDIKGMSTREEDILTSRALIKKGTVITELLKSCLIDKTIDVNDMISGDRNALMVAIRITGYGPEYKVDMQCGECEKKTQREFRLDQLAIKRLEIEPAQPGQNLFQFKMPRSKLDVLVKFLTGRDEEEILTLQERMKKVSSLADSIITTQLKYSIVSLNGKTDKSLIAQAVPKLSSQDSLALRKFIEKNQPGIDMTQETTCDACGHSEEVSIPFGTGFFWPQS